MSMNELGHGGEGVFSNSKSHNMHLDELGAQGRMARNEMKSST